MKSLDKLSDIKPGTLLFDQPANTFFLVIDVEPPPKEPVVFFYCIEHNGQVRYCGINDWNLKYYKIL